MDASLAGENSFVITRVFDAPRDAVWRAWTKPEEFARWFGPKGFMCRVFKHELQAGGVTHSYLKSPEGAEMWGRFVYREIKEPSRLGWVHSFTDANGEGNVRHPYNATWPLELMTVVDFEDAGKQTKLTLSWTPIDPTEMERKTFVAGMDGMKQGWGGTFEQLEGYLKA